MNCLACDWEGETDGETICPECGACLLCEGSGDDSLGCAPDCPTAEP